MKRPLWIFILLLSLIVVLVEFDLARRSARLAAYAKEGAATKTIVDAEPKTFEQNFQQLSDVVADLETAPSDTDDRIQTLSKNLSDKQMQRLAEVMKDKKAKEDQRTLAVELIARHKTVQSLKKLEDFIVEPGVESKNKKSDLESALRAQAIEGIAAYPEKDIALSTLSSLDPQVDESFLKDRISRSMATLKDQVENSEGRPKNSLQNLVE